MSDIELFRQFLDEQIADGVTNLSPEESVAQWRESRQELEESAAVLRQAMADQAAGDQGTPLREFLEDFATRTGLLGAHELPGNPHGTGKARFR